MKTVVCPHCDGTGKGPQSGEWGALLTSAGVIPTECQNCHGSGAITVTDEQFTRFQLRPSEESQP